MASLHSRALLDEGRALLDPVLEPHGYSFALLQEAQGSGGSFAVGCYTHGERRVELHVRRALGIVLYRLGEATVDHRDYVAYLGVRSRYPGFSDDPVDSFRHLAADLQGVCAGFVVGTDDDSFRFCAQRLHRDPGAFRGRGLPG